MTNNNTRQLAAQLIELAVREGLIEDEDRIYAANRLCDRLRLDGGLPVGQQMPAAIRSLDMPGLLQALADEAAVRGVIDDLSDLREMLQADLMNVFIGRPSAVNRQFWDLYARSPQEATDWFYHLNQASHYIQTDQIARNILYRAPSEYGSLDITINLAKPEKNPRDIAAARLVRSRDYPACQLCVENEGYAGRIGYPARANHRLIRLRLAGEPWYFQYSPYSYYPEHCIILAEAHRDMAIDNRTFVRLLEFVARFPHYFAGSNADLPIVGGSILTHDHYQGGRYELPMARAGAAFTFELPRFAGVSFSALRWPMSVIRLQGAEPAGLVAAADRILSCWRDYDDPAVGVIARSGPAPHNTLTPIARRRGAAFEMDLVLRNNRQNADHPLGIFHPHADVHHIKKENIGLIEVMGLAVLPARLLSELAEVARSLAGQAATVAPYHQAWTERLRQEHAAPGSLDEAEQVVRLDVGRIFERVLADAGIYKAGAAGLAGWRRLIARLRQDQASD